VGEGGKEREMGINTMEVHYTCMKTAQKTYIEGGRREHLTVSTIDGVNFSQNTLHTYMLEIS
jgi:hypothetical protein